MPVPMIPDTVPPERPAGDRQPDLFDRRSWADVRSRPEHPVRPAAPAPASLCDDELIGRLADAGPSDIDALCDEIVARSLPAAVPALEALWCRFHGFGIESPLREQCAVVETLARLKGPGARAALKRLVLSPSLPASLQPAALRAAADAGLFLPAAFVAGVLDHDDPAVREAAFELAPAALVPVSRLREGLSDQDPPIRRAAAVALAHRGDASGRNVLIADLANEPSNRIVEALGAIGDDEAIVALGRCAMRHPDFAPGVIAVLRDLGNPRADRLAAHLEADSARSNTGQAP